MKLKTLKDIELTFGNERLELCEVDDLQEVAKEWVKDCEKKMELADKDCDREQYNFYAGKRYAFIEFFNLEKE